MYYIQPELEKQNYGKKDKKYKRKKRENMRGDRAAKKIEGYRRTRSYSSPSVESRKIR